MGEEGDKEEKQPALAAAAEEEQKDAEKGEVEGKKKSPATADPADVEVKVVTSSQGTAGLTLRLSFAIFAIAFGSGFQHGYNTGVLNTPRTVIMDWIMECDTVMEQEWKKAEEVYDNKTEEAEAAGKVLDPKVYFDPRENATRYNHCEYDNTHGNFIYSQITSLFCIGGMLGGASVPLLAAIMGRKPGLLLNNILVLISAILLGTAKPADTYVLLMVGRFIIGVNAGINAGMAPMYLSEISPVALRGAVGTVYQLIITISILFSQLMGMEFLLGTASWWPYVLGLTLIPGIIQVFILPMCPESPKYLLMDKEDEARANEALVWLRAKIEVHEEMDEMKQEHATMKSLPKTTLKEMLTTSALRKPLIIAMMMMLAQQLTGINAAMFYSTQIFNSAGLKGLEAQYATLAMGVVNVLMTFVSLALIEKAGRKTLMAVGISIMFVATIMIMVCLLLSYIRAMAYLSVVFVILFVIGFATGPGSIPWFFVTELFHQSGRPIATAIAVVTNWAANWLVGLAFSPLEQALGPYVFLFFIVIQALFVVYVWFQVPETKNKTIDEITAQFR